MIRFRSRSRRALPAALLACALLWVPACTSSRNEEGASGFVRRATSALQQRSPAQDEVRPFFEKWVPDPLRRPGPRGILWWQWLAMPLLAVVAIGIGSGLGYATRRVLGHLAARTRTTWDDVLLQRLASPLTLLWGVLVASAVKPFLALGPGPDDVIEHLLRAAAAFALFWGGYCAVDVAMAIGAQRPWAKANPALANLLPFARRAAKVVLVALGAVAILTELGFNVAGLLAGVGIGGIAIALAAQKTVENMFGAFAISVDQPFREGDFVKIDDVTGTVERIGMRSTRIRTADRTLVTIPNGKLADTRAETFAARDRMRFFASLGLSHATTAEQMRTVLREIEAALRAHPKIWPDAVSVRFTEIKESALNVEVVAWFATLDGGEFTRIRQDLLLQFLEIVERAGTRLAFPTRTVHLVEEGPATRREA